MSNIRHHSKKFDPRAATQRPEPVDADRAIARIIAVWGVLAVGAVGLAARLVWLQLVDAPNLQKRAQAQQIVTVRPFVPRRPIVDRNNDLMAIDRPSYTVYVHPIQFSETESVKNPPKNKPKTITKKVSSVEMAARIAPILGEDPATLAIKFQKRKSGILLGHGLREDTIDRLRALKVDGLDIRQGENDYTRYYPQDDLAAAVLGFINHQRRAEYGVENSQSILIERDVPAYQLTQTRKQVILPDRVSSDMLHTDDLKLKLTLDLRIQRAARAALKQQRAVWNGAKGTVIVMEAETGAIRALVVDPTYNPNNYSADVDAYEKIYGKDRGSRILGDWAVSDTYEPGSTFKPLNVAIALENGIITPQSTFFDNGLVKIDTYSIRNADREVNGTIDVAQILQRSSNVGMVKLMQRLSPNIFYNWLQRLGIGQKTGIDLPSEGAGLLVDRNQFINIPIYPANAAFGQGISLTPIHLTSLISSIANGGKLVKPHVVEGLFDDNGVQKDRPSRVEPVQIFSSKNTAAVLAMMETVVTKGSGINAKISGYQIAGKTGTSQKAIRGGYDPHKKIASFVGILPVDATHHYVVFAAIDEPQKATEKAYGGNVAAPIVKSVMDSLISIDRIAPTLPVARTLPSEITLDFE